MIKRLTSHGNSLAIIIEKAILELLHITPNTPLEISTDGKNLIISPANKPERSKKFQTALSRVNQRHGKTLKRLGE